MESIWKNDFHPVQNVSLKQDLSADVIIIGAGITGILTAHMLNKQGIHAIILEAQYPGSGQTGHTTAKITMQHGMIYDKLLKHYGCDLARLYAEANQWALNDYQRIIAELHLDCDYCLAPAYLYTTSDPEPLYREYEAEAQLGLPVAYTVETELPLAVTGAVRMENQAHMNPLKLLQALADDLEIYTHMPVLSVDGSVLRTPYGNLRGDHIVFTSHYPFINFPGMFFTRMHQERSYVIAYDNFPAIQGMYLGIDPDGLSFRPYNQYLLVGGGAHRTGENPFGGQYQRLRTLTHRYWPQAREAAHWSAQDCVTLDGLPQIGHYAFHKKNWSVATGFGKWGMTLSMISARMLTDHILGKNNPWETLFSPQRTRQYFHIKPLANEITHSFGGLTRLYLTKAKTPLEKLQKGHGGLVSYDGQKVGAYKDETGDLYLVSPRCPHLGCQLEWNPDEHSWDCPCHGSRFDYTGQILDGPAQKNLNVL